MDTDIEWLKESLARIEGKLDNINSAIADHEKRISRLEGANRVWIPLAVGMVSLAAGIVIGVLGV